MLNYTKIFALRLKSARKMKDMSMAQLSEAMKDSVTPQAIYKYEAGKMLPGSSVLIKLAEVLDVSPDYFFRPFAVDVSAISFRKKSKLRIKDKEAIEETTKDRIERYLEIEDICAVTPMPMSPKKRVRVGCDSDVISAAESLRSEWGLNDKPIDNVLDLLESKGILIVEIETSADFDGLSGMAGETPVIVLNRKFPSPERKRFTALHELGHLYLSFDSDTQDKEVESMCNMFASEMLLPSELFASEMGDLSGRTVSLRDFASVQRKYGISIDALMYKAYKFGMISEKRHQRYHILKNSRPAFKEYADMVRTPEEHSDRFEWLVYNALDKKLITISKAASLLGVPVGQVDSESIDL